VDNETVTLRDYTEAFKVKKALRKLGKAHIPLKEGLFVDDIKVFGITLVLWVLSYSLVLSPPIKLVLRLLGGDVPKGIPYLFLIFVPPVLAVGMSRRPVRHNLGMFGLIRAVARDLMDDPVHRKGVPVRKGDGDRSYRIVVWRPRADLLPDLVPRLPVPNGFTTVQPHRRPLGTVRQDEPREQIEQEQDEGFGLEQLTDEELAADYVISTRRV
jgi:hypothetical protein